MKAAWDWFAPRESSEERQKLVEFVVELGFDTLIVGKPSADLVERAHRVDLQVVAVISPSSDPELKERNPECLQRMLPVEDAMLQAIQGARSEPFQRLSHRWFPLIQGSDLVCYEHEASHELLRRRVESAATTADGVALDGFGFRNHYACFCDRCRELHGGEDPELVARVSEASLVKASEVIYDHAKSLRPDFLVTNHVWPPFNPNPYYGCRLRLDYCTQTISWFYKPQWSMERVELEASIHKDLEQPDRNRFVPFIGLYADPYQTRTAERVRAELEIALRYGEGNVALCTLEGPWKNGRIRSVVQDLLRA